MKKYDEDNRSYMQMYVELGAQGERSPLSCNTVLREHLGVYFKYHDTDYDDLKRMLGIEPLSVTLIPRGTIQKFENKFGRRIRKINATRQDEIELLRLK